MFYRRKKRTRVAPKARNREEKCASKWCRNRRYLQRSYYRRKGGSLSTYETLLKYCRKCFSKQLKARRPATYVLNTLRASARKRKLPFTLTVAEFEAFCRETQYLERRGLRPGCFTIDRKDWNEGYHIWNIQVMEFMENCQQGADNTPREERGCAVVDDNEPF